MILRPVLYADERYYLQRMDEAVRCASVPYREQKLRRLDQKLDREFPHYALISSIAFPVFSRTRSAGDRADAHLAGVRTLLALAAYKDRFGSYPTSLDALEKRLGWDLPKDPFSGKQLVYRQKGKGILLYSVGENLKDDGANPHVPGAGFSWEKEYYDANGQRFADIIWRMNR